MTKANTNNATINNAKANFATISAGSLSNIKAFHNARTKSEQAKADAREAKKAEDGAFAKAIEGKEQVEKALIDAHDAKIKAIDDVKAKILKEQGSIIKTAVKELVCEEQIGLYKAYAEYHTSHKGEKKYKDAIKSFLESMGVESGEKGYSFMVKEIEQSCGKVLNKGKAYLATGDETGILKKDAFHTLVVALVHDVLVKKGIITTDAIPTEKAQKATKKQKEAKAEIKAEQVA